MTGHVESISPEFASRRDSDEDNSIISGDDNDISNFVANSLFDMVLSEQKITWPIDSSGESSYLAPPISYRLYLISFDGKIQIINWLQLIWKVYCLPSKRPWAHCLGKIYNSDYFDTLHCISAEFY